jgi:lysophospholipase L1-like esterase
MVTPVVTPRWSASSGLDAIRATRALGHNPKRWVIELGTNDAGSVTNCSCADQIAYADSLIRQLVAEIGSGSQILWVNVRGSTSGVLAINAALAARAKASPSTFQVADWNGYTDGRDAWFVDGVHPTATGAVELGRFIVAAVTALPPVPGTNPSSTASSTAQPQTGLTHRLRPLCRDPERTFRLCLDTET